MYRAAVDTTGPINRRMAYRLDMSHIQSDGWVDRGQSRSNALFGALIIDVASNVHLTLSEDWAFQRPTKYFGTPLINGVLNPDIRRVNYNVSDANILPIHKFSGLAFFPTPGFDLKDICEKIASELKNQYVLATGQPIKPGTASSGRSGSR